MRLFILSIFLFPVLLSAVDSGFRFSEEITGIPTDSYYSQTLALRFRNLARVVLPRQTKGIPPEILCTFHVPPPDGKGSFGAEQKGLKTIVISFPERFSSWSENPSELNWMARWTLFARIGFPIKKQENIPDSWIFAGVARKAASDTWKLRNIKFGKFPAAYAFASHGIFPELKDIAGPPPAPSDGFSRIVYEEWAQILLDLCIRSGAAKKGLVEQYLAYLYQNPDAEPYPLFKNAFYTHFEAYGKKKYGRFVLTDGHFDMDKWFRREAEKILLSRFLPMSLDYLETSYRQAVKLNMPQGSRTISELTRELRGKPDIDLQLQLSETLIRLTELLYHAPPTVTESLSALIQEITQFRDFGGNELSGKKLDEKEKRFFDALETQSLTENILKDAERRHVPVGHRYTLTFSESPYSEKITNPALEILDRYLKQTEKN